MDNMKHADEDFEELDEEFEYEEEDDDEDWEEEVYTVGTIYKTYDRLHYGSDDEWAAMKLYRGQYNDLRQDNLFYL